MKMTFSVAPPARRCAPASGRCHYFLRPERSSHILVYRTSRAPAAQDAINCRRCWLEAVCRQSEEGLAGQALFMPYKALGCSHEAIDTTYRTAVNSNT